MTQRLLQFIRDTRGTSLLEFVFIFPVMLLLVLGGVEVGRYITINQKVEKAGYVLTDITTQYQQQSDVNPRPGELTQDELNSKVFPQIARVMQPYGDSTNQVVILTSLRMENGVKKVKWQAAGGGELTDGVVSQITGRSPSGIDSSLKDMPATLPADIEAAIGSMKENENIIVGELFFLYTPKMQQILSDLTRGGHTGDGEGGHGFSIVSKVLSKHIYLSPRNDVGQLVCLPPNFVYPECSLVMNTGGGAGGSCTSHTSRCVNGDLITSDCDGIDINTSVCGCGSGSASCEGADYVTRDCHFNETGRVNNDIPHGCYSPPCVPNLGNYCSGGALISHDYNNCGPDVVIDPAAPGCTVCTPSPDSYCSGDALYYHDNNGCTGDFLLNPTGCATGCTPSSYCDGDASVASDGCSTPTVTVIDPLGCCDPTNPASACYNCDPSDPAAPCYVAPPPCDKNDPASPCYEPPPPGCVGQEGTGGYGGDGSTDGCYSPPVDPGPGPGPGPDPTPPPTGCVDCTPYWNLGLQCPDDSCGGGPPESPDNRGGWCGGTYPVCSGWGAGATVATYGEFCAAGQSCVDQGFEYSTTCEGGDGESATYTYSFVGCSY